VSSTCTNFLGSCVYIDLNIQPLNYELLRNTFTSMFITGKQKALCSLVRNLRGEGERILSAIEWRNR